MQCNPNAYFLPEAEFLPFTAGSFIGDTQQGGSVNCEKITLHPHGNGTHTECVGHISTERDYIYNSLQSPFAHALLLSITPHIEENGDAVITLQSVESSLSQFAGSALILRTLPNNQDKQGKQWSGSNPPYIDASLCALLCQRGIQHLLVDIPSVDKEVDGGALAAHKAFWNYPTAPRLNATITEMIFVPQHIPDGEYVVHIGILHLQSDASPSTITLYPFIRP